MLLFVTVKQQRAHNCLVSEVLLTQFPYHTTLVIGDTDLNALNVSGLTMSLLLDC